MKADYLFSIFIVQGVNTINKDQITNKERYEQGMHSIIRMVGEEGAKPIEELGRFFPDFGSFLIASGFGDIYSRPNLDLKQRELVTLSSLITQGATDQLPFHIHAALNVGLTPQEILEVVLQCAGYAGLPKACGALNVVKQVFQERGVVVE